MLHARQPSLSHLKTLGCLCYALVLPKGDKFAERSFPAIFIGYSELQKGYILLDIKHNKISVHRDVIFQENVFPFAKMMPQSQPPVTAFDSALELDVCCDSDDEIIHTAPTEDSHIADIVGPNNGSTQTNNPSLQTTSDETTQPPIPIVTSADPPTRRTTRSTREPTWMKDYTIDSKKQSSTRHPLINSLCYDNLTPTYRGYVRKVSDHVEPKHFRQAVKDDGWVHVMTQEI